MPKPSVCVLRAPGTNCDVETAFAFESAGGRASRVHLFQLLENPARLADFQVLCLPGGFSYGDDIGAGVIFSRQLRGRLSEAIGEFLVGDKLVLGVCNGFQVLLKAGILPDGAANWPPRPDQPAAATLTWNDNHKYTAIWVRLKVMTSNNVFLRGIEEIELPVAHAEGKMVVRDNALWRAWAQRGQIALCYAPRRPDSTRRAEVGSAKLAQVGANQSESVGAASRPEERDDRWRVLDYPANPNGSAANIAGLGDPTGRVLGLMPHPERFLCATQHPRWTRLGLTGDGDGLALFRNAVEYFA